MLKLLVNFLLIISCLIILQQCSTGNSGNSFSKQWIAYNEILEYGDNTRYRMRVFDSEGRNKHTLFEDSSYCSNIE